MKQLLILIGVMSVMLSLMVSAEETIREKVEEEKNDMQRAVEKKVHRAEEATCMEGDLKCLKEKATNRMEEMGDAIEDEAAEIKNELD